jgi:hypothetical protein
VFFGVDAARLPVRLRGGEIAFHPWGARGGVYADDNTPGFRSFLKAGKRGSKTFEHTWTKFDPRPTRSATARFMQISSFQVPCYFRLLTGQYIQGLIATIAAYQRVYVVTEPAPAAYVEQWPEWPRIVGRP